MMNTRGKVLHICTLDKFIPAFIDFLEEHFSDFETRHVFCISGKDNRFPINPRANIAQYRGGRRSRLIYLVEIARLIQKADKIVLHGLFDLRIVQIVACMPWVLKKCYWIMWGGDLYVYKLGDRSKESWHKNEFWRKRVIRNIGYLVTAIPGEVELARTWYEASGKHIQCFTYPSNLFEDNVYQKHVKQSGVTILVGNSADPSNGHKEVLMNLQKYANEDIRVICPLSYGDKSYATDVISYGTKVFGEKFMAITNFLPIDEYNSLLNSVDIAIFNHQRQQAMANTVSLLGMGKKVFMRSDVTQWEFLKSIEVMIYDVAKLDISKIDSNSASLNIKAIKEFFSRERLVKQLQAILMQK